MAILLLGIKEQAILFVLVMGSFFAIAIALRDGLRTIPPIYQRAGLMLGANGDFAAGDQGAGDFVCAGDGKFLCHRHCPTRWATHDSADLSAGGIDAGCQWRFCCWGSRSRRFCLCW